MSAALRILSVFIVAFLFSCNSSDTANRETTETKTTETPATPVNELAEFRFTYTIANLPLYVVRPNWTKPVIL